MLTRAIAVRCTSTEAQAKTLETVMQAAVRYATRTYEGMRVSVSLCLDFADAADGEPLVSFLEQSWAPVLGSGLTTAVQLAANGSVQRVIDLPPAPTEDLLAPDHFIRLAAWTQTEGGIGLTATRSGEVYLTTAGQLLFARRNYRWQAFPLSLITDAGWFGTTKRRLSPEVKRAFLASLLDASVAHHGACLGIIVNDKRHDVAEALLDPADRWSDAGNLRRRLFGASDFTSLSRRGRLELLSMDGATLVDQSGRIIAGGAILRVPGGSPGGGRTAAARAIGRFGVGIKVSQDGPITAFVEENGEPLVQFSMG